MKAFAIPAPASEPTVLTARHYFWIATACLAGVLYGSFVPFHVQWRPVPAAVGEFLRIVAEPLTWESGSDYLANVLLFIPLTFLWMAALCVERTRLETVLTALLVLPAASLLSASIEFTQLYFPPRVTALDDILAESIGGLIGVTAWLAVGPTLTAWCRRLWASLGKEGWAGNVLPLYLFFLVLIHVMPINLTISPAMISRKYHEGRILLVPFASLSGSGFDVAQKFLWDLIYYAPLGWLLAHLQSPGWRSWRRLPAVIGLSTLAGVSLETLQVFVWSRESDVTDALVGALAGVAGWAVTVAHFWLSQREGNGDSTGNQPSASYPSRTGSYLVGGNRLLCRLAAVRFSLSARLRGRTQGTIYVGAFWRLHGRPSSMRSANLAQTMLFIPLGAILAAAWPSADRRLVALVALLLAFMIASAVEVGQFYLPGHTASVTDVLVEMTGTVIGCALGVVCARPHAESLPRWRTNGSMAEVVRPSPDRPLRERRSRRPRLARTSGQGAGARSGWHMLDFHELWRLSRAVVFPDLARCEGARLQADVLAPPGPSAAAGQHDRAEHSL